MLLVAVFLVVLLFEIAILLTLAIIALALMRMRDFQSLIS